MDTINSIFEGIGNIGKSISDGFTMIGKSINDIIDTAEIAIVTAGSLGAVWVIATSYAAVKNARRITQ